MTASSIILSLFLVGMTLFTFQAHANEADFEPRMKNWRPSRVSDSKYADRFRAFKEEYYKHAVMVMAQSIYQDKILYKNLKANKKALDSVNIKFHIYQTGEMGPVTILPESEKKMLLDRLYSNLRSCEFSLMPKSQPEAFASSVKLSTVFSTIDNIEILPKDYFLLNDRVKEYIRSAGDSRI